MLPPVYSQRGLLLTHVPFRERVYFRGDFNQTPTAIAKIDQGYLCFVGEEGPQSEDIITAMCCGL